MSTTSAVSTRCLCKVFTSGPGQQNGIKDINIEVGQGEFTVIMGNSGSGKSTLLYLLAGLDQPTKGAIWIGEKPIHDFSETNMAHFRRQHIGFVFQDHNLISDLSLLENLLVPGYLLHKQKEEVRARAEFLMQQLEIDQLAHRYPSQVSGGERQRCAIARALINKPYILLADEPTGSLNSAASEQVLECFDHLHQSGQTVLMVTHDPKSACHGNRVLFLKDGQLQDSLSFYRKENLMERQTKLLAWLQPLGW